MKANQLACQIFFLALSKISLTRASSLTHFKDLNPDVVGEYHTVVFQSLREKYEQSSRPSALSEVIADVKEILIGYCPWDNTKGFESCVQKTNEYTHENHYRKLKQGSTRDLLSVDIMTRLENAIYDSTSKEKTLGAIETIKQDLKNDNDMEHKDAKAIAISVAKESFSLWYDVFAEEDHPFRNSKSHDGRKLQLQICLDIFAVVNADIDGATDAFNEGGILAAIINAVVASANAFFSACATSSPIPSSAPSEKAPTASPTKTFIPPSTAPSEIPSLSPTISHAPSTSSLPSFNPTLSPEPSVATNPSNIPSSTPTQVPSVESSVEPTTSFSPTVGEITLNRIITCVSVIDEAYETQTSFFQRKWEKFREFYPDRPFCLLQPAIFTNTFDEQNYAYAGGIDTVEALHIPDSFFNDEKTTFSVVKRDAGNTNESSDWFDICDLAGLREEGISRVAFFIDESGSLTRDAVEESLDLFQEKLDLEGIEVVAAIYNDEEDWVQPFLTNFGFQGPTPNNDDFFNTDDFLCRKSGQPDGDAPQSLGNTVRQTILGLTRFFGEDI